MEDFYKLSIDELKNRRAVLLKKRESRNYTLADLEELETISIAIHYKEVELPILDRGLGDISEDDDEFFTMEELKKKLQEERLKQ